MILIDINDKSTLECLEGSYFAAYKCTFQGAITMEPVKKAIFTKMTMIDNILGFTAMA